MTAVRIVDTRVTPWIDPPTGEPFNGTSVKVKVLARHADGWASAQLLWVPPGLASINPHKQAERHYHSTVREWVLMLDGDLPYREYEDMQSPAFKPVVFRSGTFLDRQPGDASVHGTEPGGAPTHAVCLEIRDGRATAPGETGYLQENVSITDADLAAGKTPPPLPAGATRRVPFTLLHGPAVVHSTPTVRIVETQLLEWRTPGAGDALHGVPGALVKNIVRTDDDAPYFEFAYLPPGVVDPAPPRYVYVLEGELVTAAGSARAGAFVESPEATPATGGPTGCVAVRWRDPS